MGAIHSIFNVKSLREVKIYGLDQSVDVDKSDHTEICYILKQICNKNIWLVQNDLKKRKKKDIY